MASEWPLDWICEGPVGHVKQCHPLNWPKNRATLIWSQLVERECGRETESIQYGLYTVCVWVCREREREQAICSKHCRFHSSCETKTIKATDRLTEHGWSIWLPSSVLSSHGSGFLYSLPNHPSPSPLCSPLSPLLFSTTALFFMLFSPSLPPLFHTSHLLYKEYRKVYCI